MKKVFETSAEIKKRSTVAAILATAMGAFCLVLGGYLVYDGAKPVVGILFAFVGIMQLLRAWITLSIAKIVRLVTTPEKLEFHSPGLELSTTWDNLERIGSMAGGVTSIQYDSLILRRPAKQKTSRLFKLFRKHPEKEIPLSMFSNWRKSEMGEEIKKYAPHLFENGSDTK